MYPPTYICAQEMGERQDTELYILYMTKFM